MTELNHRTIETNGIAMHIAEQGQGPLIVLCHGFPESWYSWRHQLSALAEAGFHAVAPDMRGYGQTDAPREIDQYTLWHLVGHDRPARHPRRGVGRDRRPRLGRARSLARRPGAPGPLSCRHRAQRAVLAAQFCPSHQ